MTTTIFERGDFVIYRAANGTPIEGIIRAAHRDGCYTVEARHILDQHGRRMPGYLGYRYRIEADDLHARNIIAVDDGPAIVDVSKLTPVHRQLVAHLARVLEPQAGVDR